MQDVLAMIECAAALVCGWLVSLVSGKSVSNGCYNFKAVWLTVVGHVIVKSKFGSKRAAGGARIEIRREPAC